MASWKEPFSLEGEEISYIVSITNFDTGANMIQNVKLTTYTFSPSTDVERNCTEYQFTILSRNGYSMSNYAVSEKKNIPTGIHKPFDY